jgi:asparagine synthase (glutamine-hydrolysing)
MCGIAGYFGTQEIELRRVSATLNSMQRRGPDHRAHRRWVNLKGRRCELLHARLSIIDLDPRAHQPFAVGKKAIVFNGELYNYRELREDLRSDGIALRTESDTEVLLAAIDHFGWSVLDRCEGMWAFAVYDDADGSLTLCRDRFGEKPLYVYQNAGNYYFGSEPKNIFELVGRCLDVNEDHLQRYMVNGYKAIYKCNGETFFRDLTEVAAGTVVRIDANGHADHHRYWQPACNIDEGMTYSDAVAGARERLIRSVELRLRADVPIAFCMSGGVDSNSLISIAKNIFDYDVHGFTIVNTDSRYEEQDLIEESVAELNIRHTNIPVNTRDFLSQLRKLVKYHDAPVYTITYFAHWLLMKSVADHGYRISVSGTAADELFTGYFDHHLFYLAEIHDDRNLYERAVASWEREVRPIVRNPFLQDPQIFVDNPEFRDHIFLNADKFSRCLHSEWREQFSEEMFTDHLLRNRMMNELFHEATPVILHEDDANAMYYSIENRSPFLDRELYEHCYRIPTRHLMRDGYAKVVLRDAMRGITPNCVLDNPRKVGFNAPIFSFLDVRDPDVKSQLLDRSPIFDIVRRETIEDIVMSPEIPNSESKFLFNVLNSKLFLEEYGSGNIVESSGQISASIQRGAA